MPDIFIDKNAETQEDGEGEQPLPSHEATPPHPQPTEGSETWSDKHGKNISLLSNPSRTPGVLTAFAPRPLGIKFEDQEPHEEILLLLRRHFVSNLPWIITILVFAFLPFLLLPLFSDALFAPYASVLPEAFPFVALCLYYLILAGFALNQFVTWFYQVGIVTNIRVIDVDFNSLLARNIAYTDITDIVDTEAHQSGLLQGIFNYGNVGIQTAGMKANFEFTKIPKPNKVVDLISDLMRNQKHHG